MESMESMERMESTSAGNGVRISLGQEAFGPATRGPSWIKCEATQLDICLWIWSCV